MTENSSTVLLSAWSLFVQTIFWSLIVYGLALVINASEQKFNPSFFFAEFELTQKQIVLCFALILLGFWISSTISGLHEYSIALKVISWNYEDLEFIPLGLCYLKAVIFHLGTVLFGALITSLFKLLILIIEFVNSRTKKVSQH